MPITENTQRTIDNLLLGAYTQSAKTTNFPRKRIDPLPSGTQVASDDFKDLCFAEKKRFLELLAVYGKDFVDQYRHKVNLNNGKQLKARTVLKLDAKVENGRIDRASRQPSRNCRLMISARLPLDRTPLTSSLMASWTRQSV